MNLKLIVVVVFLIGFMASGKTTIGRKLAEQMKLDFIDLDAYIEEKEGMQVREFFAKNGETAFREIEKKALEELMSKKNAIIATGGGTPCYYSNLDAMIDKGITIYVKAEVKQITERLSNTSLDDRPLLKDKSPEELHNYVFELLEHRHMYYQKAELTVDSQKVNIEKLAEVINTL